MMLWRVVASFYVDAETPEAAEAKVREGDSVWLGPDIHTDQTEPWDTEG